MSGKKTKMMVICTVFVLLLVSSINTVALSDSHKVEKIIGSKAMVLKNKPIDQKIYFNKEAVEKDKLMVNNDIDNIQITDSSDDEYQPSLITNQFNAMVMYESYNGSKKDVYLKNSNDYGQTWSNPFKITIGNDEYYSFLNNYDFKSPSLGIRPGWNKAFGSMISSYKDSSVYCYFPINNIGSTLSYLSISILDWSNVSYNQSTNEFTSFYDFKNMNIIYYSNQTTPWVIALIGSTNYSDPDTGEGPCDDTPMFSFIDLVEPEESIAIAWFPEIQHCSNLSIANQYGSETIYGVCEIKNGTKHDLLFFKGKPYDWYYGDHLVNKTITSDQSLLHPKITLRNNHVYIVAETDTNGIVLYRSSDGGNTWNQPINITESLLSPTAKPSYPDITVNETHITCTFIESGNLSLTQSNDSGVNWTTPLQLNTQNQSVVSGYSYTDIGSTYQIIWTDNRNTNKDIYYYLSYTPKVDLKIINFTLKNELFIPKTNNMISVTMKNQGDGYAENIQLKIIYKCENETETTLKTEIIPQLNSGDTRTALFSLFPFKNPDYFQAFKTFAGIQNITVIIDSNHKYESESDETFEDNILTKTITYQDIFPVLGKFKIVENIFKSLKKIGQ